MKEHFLETVNMKRLGKELQQARIRKKLTQEQAAQLIKVARTTLVAIEKGDRRIKADELADLAQAYDMQMSDFLREHSEITWSLPQFRGPTLRTEEYTEIAPAIETLTQLAKDYFELERMTKTPLLHKYPPEYSIGHLSIREAAEQIALEERLRLGIGDGQIPVLHAILEQDVGLRIFYYSMPSKCSAIYLFEERIGGCIAINSNHPEERRRWSLAHDYGHFLFHRTKPTISGDDTYQRKPESERIADEFAGYFLLPTAGVVRRFNEIRRTKNAVTPADVCSLAFYYGVSVEAMTRRLEMLKLLPAGLWERLQARGFRVREAQKQLGLLKEEIPIQKLPARYHYLALEAFEQAQLSEGMLARFLGVDLLTARSFVEEMKSEKVKEMTDLAIADDPVVSELASKENEYG